jgi:glycine dehydrogenase subunit 1
MCLIGKDGLKDLASLCHTKAEYTKKRLSEIKGVEVKMSSPTFNEFVIKLPVDPDEIIGKLIDRGFEAGFPLGKYYDNMENFMLIAVTEKRTKSEINMFADLLEDALWS